MLQPSGVQQQVPCLIITTHDCRRRALRHIRQQSIFSRLPISMHISRLESASGLPPCRCQRSTSLECRAADGHWGRGQQTLHVIMSIVIYRSRSACLSASGGRGTSRNRNASNYRRMFSVWSTVCVILIYATWQRSASRRWLAISVAVTRQTILILRRGQGGFDSC